MTNLKGSKTDHEWNLLEKKALKKKTKMEVLNYEKVMEYDPYIEKEIVNQLGQKVKFAEYPFKTDYPVIAIFEEHKKVVVTEFWDCEDFYTGSDYNPCITEDNEIVEHYEL